MSRMILPYGTLAFLGFVVGVVGTAGHRFEPYVGSVCVLALVLAGGVFARAWKSWTGLLLFTMAWITVVLLLYYRPGPGESVVIVGDALGKTWLFGGAIAAVVPAFLPGRLMKDGPHDEG